MHRRGLPQPESVWIIRIAFVLVACAPWSTIAWPQTSPDTPSHWPAVKAAGQSDAVARGVRSIGKAIPGVDRTPGCRFALVSAHSVPPVEAAVVATGMDGIGARLEVPAGTTPGLSAGPGGRATGPKGGGNKNGNGNI